jgi:hypothetical protein
MRRRNKNMKQKIIFTILLWVALIPSLFSQEYYFFRGLSTDMLSNDSCWFTVRNGGGISLAGQGFTVPNRYYVIGCSFVETKAPWTVSGEGSKIILGDRKVSNSATLNVIYGNTLIADIEIVPCGESGEYNSKIMLADPTLPTITSIGNNCTVQFSSSTGTQYIPALNYYNLEITGSGSKILQGSFSVSNSLTITGNNLEVDFGSYVITGAATFLGYGTHTVLKTSDANGIKGNISITGGKTFSASLCYNYYGSVSNQPTGFSTLGISDCDYLEIANPNSVTLDKDVTIANNLKFTNGKVYLGDFNMSLGQNCVTSGTCSADNCIVLNGAGIVTKNFYYDLYSPLIIPIADSKGRYAPITINAFTSGTTAGYFSFTTKNEKDPYNTSTTNYLKRHWDIVVGDFTIAPTVTMTFQYNSTYDIIGTESLIVGGIYSGGLWSPLSNVNTTSHSFMAINKTIAANKSNTIHITGGEEGAMPVQLNSFTSSVNKNEVKLNWQTASEINNSGFEIYRKLTGSTDYSKIGFVKGNGTINTQSNYSFTDRNMTSGKYSYRLKQIDNNGNYEYFNLENDVVVGIPNNYELSQNYPNPFNPSTKINFAIPKDQKVSIKIYNILGKETASLVNDYKTAGFYTVEFNAGNLSSGTYFYVLQGENFTQTKKMTLIK